MRRVCRLRCNSTVLGMGKQCNGKIQNKYFESCWFNSKQAMAWSWWIIRADPLMLSNSWFYGYSKGGSGVSRFFEQRVLYCGCCGKEKLATGDWLQRAADVAVSVILRHSQTNLPIWKAKWGDLFPEVKTQLLKAELYNKGSCSCKRHSKYPLLYRFTRPSDISFCQQALDL